MGSQHVSPNVETLCSFEPNFWPEIITQGDAENTYFNGSRTSCDLTIGWHFWAKCWPEKITYGTANHPSGPVRDTPPYRAIPFRDSIAQGGIAPFAVFIGHRASIAEMPLLRGGGIAPSLRMLSKGETLRKGGRGIAPIGHVKTTQKPHNAQ